MGITMSTMLRFYNKYKYSLPVRRYLTERQTITKFFEKYYFGFLSKEEEEVTPVSEWDYEGTMTVGTDEGIKYGYIDDPGSLVYFGSMSVEYPYDDSNESKLIFYDVSEPFLKVSGEIEKIEIGGIEYDGFTYYSGVNQSNIEGLSSNPFPAVGNTVTIKIKLAV